VLFAERSSGRDARGIMCENMAAIKVQRDGKTKETDVVRDKRLQQTRSVSRFQLLLITNHDSTEPAPRLLLSGRSCGLPLPHLNSNTETSDSCRNTTSGPLSCNWLGLDVHENNLIFNKGINKKSKPIQFIIHNPPPTPIQSNHLPQACA
jgi:hypothetical protein